MAVDAIILAGAMADPDMKPDDREISRAMIPVAGKSMLQWLTDALSSASSVSRIIAVGDVQAEGLDQVLDPLDTFLDNIMLGIAAAEGDRVLITSSDIPLITPEAIDDFVTHALTTDADFCFPIIPKEDCMSNYPQLKRTYAKTREGTFTGGNMVLVSRQFMKRNEKIIGEVYNQRKNILRLAGIIGFSTLIRAFLAQIAFPVLLPVPKLEQTVGKMLGGKVQAIVTHHAEIGEDVDKPNDLAVAREILSIRGTRG